MSGYRVMEGHVAVIIGAVGRVGESLAWACASAGAEVVLADIDTGGLDRIAASLAAEKHHGMVMSCDVTAASEVQELAELTWEKYGQVNLLVNSLCCRNPAAPQASPSGQSFEELINSRLTGVARSSLTFLPLMLDQDSPGWLVNAVDFSSGPIGPGHVLSKAIESAVVAFSHAVDLQLRLDGAPVGVSVLSCDASSDSDLTAILSRSEKPGGEAFDGTLAARILEGVAGGAFAISTSESAQAAVSGYQEQLATRFRPLSENSD